jgi:hypothetical protein
MTGLGIGRYIRQTYTVYRVDRFGRLWRVGPVEADAGGAEQGDTDTGARGKTT